MTGAGHVFVVQGDVTTIACDAWLCPTDRGFFLTEGFARALGVGGRITGHEWAGRRAIPFQRAPADEPLVVLADVGRVEPEGPDDLAGTIEGLLPVLGEYASAAVTGDSLRPDRPARLALPLIGTGSGGLAGAKGSVIAPLLAELQRLAVEQGVDFVLCTADELAWSAVQRGREIIQMSWPLHPREEALARKLAEQARVGRLVLFIGAGVSRDAGLPDWRELLDRIAAPKLNEAERGDLSSLDLRDYATLVERELGSRQALLDAIHEKTGGDRRVGLTHALLASLGAEQAVTTNYDNLFERACARPGAPVEDAITVLPYGQVREGRPWLLKLHGSLDAPNDDIVLTRSDYMGLPRRSGALFGIVQALLVTKHLLFVGYSLSDEDFHQLVDEIRTAIGPPGQRPRLGTVLTVAASPWAKLWDDLLEVEQLGDGQPADGARRLQILLDRVAHLATSHHSHLLDPTFDGLLDSEEQRLASAMRDLERVADDIGDHPTAGAVRTTLRAFGAASTELPRVRAAGSRGPGAPESRPTDDDIARLAAVLANLSPQQRAPELRVSLEPDESRWFLAGLDRGLFEFHTCSDCARLKKYGIPGPDEFLTPSGDRRHLYSDPSAAEPWLNREYLPHLAGYSRAVLDLGYDPAVSSLSRYRTFGRDLITKRAGGRYETDAEFYAPDGSIWLHLEAKAAPRDVERISAQIDATGTLAALPDRAAKELEYVLDLAPQHLWLFGPGSIEPAPYIYRVDVDGVDARFERLDALPQPPS